MINTEQVEAYLDDIRKRLEELQVALKVERAERDALKSVLRQIITDLPAKRDWLDPHLEAQAKDLIK